MLTLAATEFLRRFVQHILPRGLVCIRQYGYLANCSRRTGLALARQLLATRTQAA
ncbi:MAG: transposase [Bryobacteraceae bacterium]